MHTGAYRWILQSTMRHACGFTHVDKRTLSAYTRISFADEMESKTFVHIMYTHLYTVHLDAALACPGCDFTHPTTMRYFSLKVVISDTVEPFFCCPFPTFPHLTAF